MALVELFVLAVAPMLAVVTLDLLRYGQIVAPDITPHWGLVSIFALVNFMLMVAMGLYHARQRSGLLAVVMRIVVALGCGCLIMLAFNAMLVEPSFAPNVVPMACTLAALLCVLVRLVMEHWIDDELFKRRVLVFGAGGRAGSIVQLRRRSDRRGFKILGYIGTEADSADSLVPVEQRLRADTDLLEYCRSRLVDEVVVAMDDRRRAFPMRDLLECRLDGVEVTELVTFLERETGKVRLDVLNPSWMIFSDGFRRGRIHAALERALDVLMSFTLLLATFPIMLLTALAIKLEDGVRSPLLYGQVRVGERGRSFRVLKFRSMRTDAEREGKPVWATQNDSRVTRIGSFIRKTRIDELPQILNVLRGEMSFVGPRPERPEFVTQLEEKIPYYRERHTIKPGITGWAQLCYPYGSSERDALEKLQYDLYYVKNHSLLFYFAILLQTVEVVLWRKGSR